MGTRNLQVVVLNNEIRVANYAQFDGYIGGQGLTALKFLRESMNESFKEKVAQCSWITPAEAKKLWVKCGAKPNSDMVGMDVSDKFKANYLHLHRDCGADIYALIQNSVNGLKLQNDINFAADSLFCEWVYVIDLDKNTFEVFKGFNQEKLVETERFAFLNDVAEKGEDNMRGDVYYPVKLAKSYSLDNLPTEEQILADFQEKEEE